MAKNKALELLEEAIGTETATVMLDVIGPAPSTPAARLEALKRVEAEIDKLHDTKHSIMRMGDKVGVPLPCIPTNMPSIDRKIIQCGGIPRGRIIELFGPESGGKTTLALEIIAAEQEATGNLCAFVDAEHALDPTWAAKQGVKVDDLIIAQPDSGEQALDTVIALVKSRAVSLIVVDSVSALVPKAELDGDMGDSHMGLQARLMSQACRKLRGICGQTGVTVIFINQIREKIGVMFGSPETTSGGRALKFFASVRLDVRRVGQIKDGEEIIGHQTKIKAVKNKVGSPFKEVLVDLLYDSGFNKYGDWLDYAVTGGVIEKSGAWFSFNGVRVGQGRINAYRFLEANPDVLQRVREALDKAETAC